MGNIFDKSSTGSSKLFVMDPLLEETQFFALWSIEDVRLFHKRFQKQIHGFSLVEAQFSSLMLSMKDPNSTSTSQAETPSQSAQQSMNVCPSLDFLFTILDYDHDGRLDGHELIGGLALVCLASFEEKCRFIFELFDINLSATMSLSELTFMIISAVNGLNSLTGSFVIGSTSNEALSSDISLQIFENLAQDAMSCILSSAAYDEKQNVSQAQISFEEFLVWARTNRDLMAALEQLHRLSIEAKLDIQNDDSADEAEDDANTGDDLIISTSIQSLYSDEPALLFPPIGDPIDHQYLLQSSLQDDKFTLNDNDLSIPATPLNKQIWRAQVIEPSRISVSSRTTPNANLSLSHIFGFNKGGGKSAASTRGRVRTSGYFYYPINDGTSTVPMLVFASASIVVVQDLHSKSQSFYQLHRSEVTTLAIHHGENIIASGDLESNIHIWTLNREKVPICLSIIQSIVSSGVKNLAFSPDGKRIAVVNNDSEYTLSLYEVSTGKLISSSLGISHPFYANDISYSRSGLEIVMVGKNQIKFFLGVHTNQRSIDTKNAKIGSKGMRQDFCSCTYIRNDEVIVGCQSGEIYRLKGYRCINIIQAHSIGEPVLSLDYYDHGGVILSGGSDSVVKTWDSDLKEVGYSIDINSSEDSSLSEFLSINPAIVSVEQQIKTKKILISTLGGCIVEISLSNNPNDLPTFVVHGWSHSTGQVWGLSTHPLKNEFITVGDDATIRFWSLKLKEMVQMRKMPLASRAVSYSNNGNLVCIGMIDGSVCFMDPTNKKLKVFSTFKHSNLCINEVKFSPDDNYLAVASEDNNIYIYRKSTSPSGALCFIRQSVCIGHTSGVISIDFSANGLFLRSNSKDKSLYHWDIMSGSPILKNSQISNLYWHTNHCACTWSTMAIHDNNDFEISTVSGLEELEDLAVGDCAGVLNLYPFPAVDSSNTVSQKYYGHSSCISKIRFSWNRRILISVGAQDHSIFLWRHDTEIEDSESIEGSDDSSFSDSDNSVFHNHSDHPEIFPRSPLQEAANLGTIVSLKDIELANSDVGKLIKNPPWRTTIVEPTNWKTTLGSTDVDFNLHWVHGYRSHDCRNNLLYASDNSIVYNVAKLAVVYHKPSGKQKFLMQGGGVLNSHDGASSYIHSSSGSSGGGGGHTDEVISITSHPAQHLFATGQAGRNASVLIWQSKDMMVVSRLNSISDHGVAILSFNPDGNLLACIGLDDNNTLSVYDWQKGAQIISTPTSRSRVISSCFLLTVDNTNSIRSTINGLKVNDIIITAGKQNLKFWWWQGRNVQVQNGIWGQYKDFQDSTSVMCIHSPHPWVSITGLSNGSLLVWEKFHATNSISNSLGISYPHLSAITTMWSQKGNPQLLEDLSVDTYLTYPRIYTADRNGVICIWCLYQDIPTQVELPPRLDIENSTSTYNLALVKTFNISSLNPAPINVHVKSICEKDGVILIGLSSSEIFELREEHIPYNSLKNTLDIAFGMKNDVLVPPNPNLHNSDLNKVNESKTDSKDIKLPVPPITLFDQVPKSVEIPAIRISSAHHKGKINGLVTHSTLQIYLTCSEDKSVRCWSLEKNKLLSYFYTPYPVTSISLNPRSLNSFVISLSDGTLLELPLRYMIDPSNINKSSLQIDPNLSQKNVTLDLNINELISKPNYNKIINNDENEDVQPTETKSMIKPDLPKVKLTQSSSPNDIRVITTLRESRKWAIFIKHSFCSTYLLASLNDSIISIIDIATFTELRRFSGHSRPSNSLDFGVITRKNLPVDFNIFSKVNSIDNDPSNDLLSTNVSTAEISKNPNDSDLILLKKTTSSYVKAYITESFNLSDLTIEIKVRIPLHSLPESYAENLIKLKKGEDCSSFINASMDERFLIEVHSRKLSPYDLIVQSTSTKAGELIFWYPHTSSIISSPSLIKDAWWSSYTVPYGWSVQGFWPLNQNNTAEDTALITAVTCSNSYKDVPVVVASTSYGELKLFNYPCVQVGAPDKCYRGHLGPISCLAFSLDDKYCISTGNEDKSIFIWETDIEEEIRERNAILGTELSNLITEQISKKKQISTFKYSEYQYTNDDFIISRSSSTITSNKREQKLNISPEGKSWKNSIREPSNFTEDSEIGSIPISTLNIKYVYGYRGWDCRNNLHFCSNMTATNLNATSQSNSSSSNSSVSNNSTKVNERYAYHVGSVGIVLNSTLNTQIINTEHTSDISCLTVYSPSSIIATGEIVDPKNGIPKLVLWDANTGVTLRVIYFHTVGISHVAFSNNGQFIISCGMDDDLTISIHDTLTGGLISKGKHGKSVEILSLSVSQNIFMTGGVNLIRFWDFPTSFESSTSGGELSSKTGIFTKNYYKTLNITEIENNFVICSSVFMNYDCITGMVDGSLLLWKDRSCSKVIPNAHKTGTPITAMTVFYTTNSSRSDGKEAGLRVFTGGRDGFVHMWDLQLNKIWSLNLIETTPKSSFPHIQALSAHDNSLLIGTRGSEIYCVNLLSNNDCKKVMHGHFNTYGEVLALDVHPSNNHFITGADDHTLRRFDSKSRLQMNTVRLNSKIKCLAYYPNDGSLIAVGLDDGTIKIITDDLQQIITSFSVGDSQSFPISMSYTADGSILAVGTSNGTIHISETKVYSCKFKLYGHHGAVSHLDASMCGQYIQSVSSTNELFYWDIIHGKQVLSPVTVRDCQWRTLTCPYSWATQGIWPSDNSINFLSVDRSSLDSSEVLLAASDDKNGISIFKYPGCIEGSLSRRYKGHSAPAPKLKFSFNNNYLYSVGGIDKSIIQYEIKK